MTTKKRRPRTPARKKRRNPGPKPAPKPELKSTMETGTSHGGPPLPSFDRPGPYEGSGHGTPED